MQAGWQDGENNAAANRSSEKGSDKHRFIYFSETGFFQFQTTSKAAYSGLTLNQDKATKPQTVQIVRQGEATPYWFKVNPLYIRPTATKPGLCGIIMNILIVKSIKNGHKAVYPTHYLTVHSNRNDPRRPSRKKERRQFEYPVFMCPPEFQTLHRKPPC